MPLAQQPLGNNPRVIFISKAIALAQCIQVDAEECSDVRNQTFNSI